MGKTNPETLKLRNPEEKLAVDRYFKDMNRPQTPEERAELVGLIDENGFSSSSPIILWVSDGREIIADGYNRYEIVTERNIPFWTIEMEFEDREDVRIWIIKNQHGRRNDTKAEIKYNMGMRYNLEKKSQGRKNPEIGGFESVAHYLANKYHCSHSTIEEAGAYADDINTLAKNSGRKWYAVISSLIETKEAGVKDVALLTQYEPEHQKEILDKHDAEKTPIRELVKDYTRKSNKKPKKDKTTSTTTDDPKAPVTSKEPTAEELAIELMKREFEVVQAIVNQGLNTEPTRTTGGQVSISETKVQETDEVKTESTVESEPIVEPIVAPVVETVAPIVEAIEPVSEPVVEEGVLIPEIIPMTVFRVNPEYFKENEGKLQFDISLKGERRSCVVYQIDGKKICVEMPNVENVIFDFKTCFGCTTVPIFNPIPERATSTHKYPLSVEKWNNTVSERFPALAIQEAPQEKSIPVDTKPEKPKQAKEPTQKPESKEKQEIAKYYPAVLRFIANEQKTLREICEGAEGLKEVYADAEENGKASIKNGIDRKLRKSIDNKEVEKIEEGKSVYFKAIQQPKPKISFDELVMQAITAEGLDEGNLINLLMEKALLNELEPKTNVDIKTDLENLVKAGKLAIKAHDNVNRYYPVETA